jgi:hypothetical protein
MMASCILFFQEKPCLVKGAPVPLRRLVKSWEEYTFILFAILMPLPVATNSFISWKVIVPMQFPQDPPALVAISIFNSWEVIVSMPFPQDIPELVAISSPFNGWEVASL